jgi:hemolysin activation/secretion protein
MVLRLFVSLSLASIAFSASAEEPVYLLTKLLISDSEVKASALPHESGGNASLFIEDVPLLNTPEFRAQVEKFIGQPIGNEVLNGLANAISDYARKHDRYLVQVKIPNQNITTGTLRLAVVVGRYSQLSFKGNRWFSSKLLQERLGIKMGDEVRLSVLEEAVNWANTNPFRQVKVYVNNLASDPGKADLVVGVQERVPFRLVTSYDDAGTDILGNNRYSAALQFGNLWGRDHQGSYQFVTTGDTAVYQAHAFDYKVPFSWRHFLDVSGSYARFRPTFLDVFTQEGESTTADIRYTIPLETGPNPLEISAGVNFKQSNNDLEFGGTNVLSSKTDSFQGTLGLTWVRRDKRGAWAVGANLNASPGDLNSRNSRRVYDDARTGASPRYVYGTLSLQRSLTLGAGWDLFSRAYVQISDGNLLGNEQLTIGGVTTVRGYDTNVFAGDQGFALTTELQAPVWQQSLSKLSKKLPPLQTRFIGFFDVAHVSYKERYGLELDLEPLASIGTGARLSISNNFSLALDYGWQLTHLARQATQAKRPPLESRGHIKAVLAF